MFTRQKGVSFTRFVDVILLVNGIKISGPHGQHAGTGSQPYSACTLIACAIETHVDLDCPAPFALEDFRENDTDSKTHGGSAEYQHLSLTRPKQSLRIWRGTNMETLRGREE